MRKVTFILMLVCIAGFVFTNCHNDEKPGDNNNKAAVTVKYNFVQSFDLHNAVDVEITYYDLETGEIATKVLPAELKDGIVNLELGDKDTLVCAFYIKFKSKEGFEPSTGETYQWKFDYNLDVIVEQEGKETLMWSDESRPLFEYNDVNPESVSNLIELLNEDEVAAGCVVKKENDSFYIFDKTNNIGELFK